MRELLDRVVVGVGEEGLVEASTKLSTGIAELITTLVVAKMTKTGVSSFIFSR